MILRNATGLKTVKRETMIVRPYRYIHTHSYRDGSCAAGTQAATIGTSMTTSAFTGGMVAL